MALTIKQIKMAIESLLESGFQGITVHKTGVAKDFNRPSFHVRLDNLNSDQELFSKTRSMDVEIHYFPPEIYQHTIDLLEVQETLESIFELNFVVQDRVITIPESTSIVVDGVLHFSFSFSYAEPKPVGDPGEPMQELSFNG